MDKKNSKGRNRLGMSARRKVSMLLSCVKDFLDGVDFTIPDRMYDRGRLDGAMYYATPSNMLKNIFQFLNQQKHAGFLDIGSGKGYVLVKAWKYGFHKVGGVEYDEKLVETCKKNMRKLGIENAVEVFCCNAAEFSAYGDYDVFYFLNPFSDEMMQTVINKILEQTQGKEITIIYFRPRYPKAIEACGLFRLEKQYFDKVTGYWANIYRGWVPEENLFENGMPHL